jgi:hypothetical protein
MEFKDLLVEHDYYCSDSSYYDLKFETKYATFADFYHDNGFADEDWNLVFRFDIYKKEDSEESENLYSMQIFVVHQRKGRFVPFFIETIYETDFDMIKEYLEKRYLKIQNLWKPFSDLK